MSNRHPNRLWGVGVGTAAAAAAMIGMGTAHADTPDDVIGQTVTELNQGNVVLDAASTADLSARQADALVEQTSLSTQTDPILLQLESLQDSLPGGNQALLGSVDEQLVTAAQNVVSADQAFVAADQAGDLSSNSFLPIDLTNLEADLGLSGALLSADFESFLTLFDPNIGSDTAATAAATATDPAGLLSEATTNFTDADNVLGEVPTSDIPNLILSQVNEQTGAVLLLNNFALTENSIASFDNGELSNLVTPFFADFDQNWLQASEAVLNADTALETAITSGTGLTAAELGTLVPELQTMGDVFVTESIDQTAYLLSQF